MKSWRRHEAPADPEEWFSPVLIFSTARRTLGVYGAMSRRIGNTAKIATP